MDDVGGRVAWSDEANLIAFSRFRSQKDRHTDIFTMRPDGTDQRCWSCDRSGRSQQGNDQPAWHPSGD